MKRIRKYLFALTLASLISGYGLMMMLPGKKVDERAVLRELAPGLVFSEKKTGPPHYRTAEGVIAFNTYDIVPSVRGYAGPIKVLLVLTPAGKIMGIGIIDHRETKNYVHYMETPDYLNRYLGKGINDPFEINKDVDGISRATVSVEALAKTVRDSSRTVASTVLGIETGPANAGPAGGTGWVWYLVLFTAAFGCYFITRRTKNLLRTRDIFLVLSILITGIYLSTPFSILHVFNLLLLRPSSAPLWYAVLSTTAVSLIFAGRFYCGWLCPFGALSEFIGRPPFRKWSVPVSADDSWRRFKYLLLGVILTLVFVSRRPEFGNFETYVTLFSLHGNILAWSLVGITLLANIRIERFWCRYLCPVAAFTGLLSKKTEGYPSRTDCPIGNRPLPLISECIRCNRCYRKTGT